MKRHFLPGGVDRHGVARPLPHCTGSCNGGRTACTCATGMVDCELAGELGPDAARIIQPPMRTPEDDAYIARVRRRALLAIAAAFSMLGALLGIADARWVP